MTGESIRMDFCDDDERFRPCRISAYDASVRIRNGPANLLGRAPVFLSDTKAKIG